MITLNGNGFTTTNSQTSETSTSCTTGFIASTSNDAIAGSIHWTEFPDKHALSLTPRTGTWEEFLDRLRNAGSYPSKDACPLLKLAVFGNNRAGGRSLRNNDNVIQIYGVEGDYDGEVKTMQDAADLFTSMGVKAVLYPSPSNGLVNPPHSFGGPRWRVFCPLSKPHPPQRREHLVARLNGVLSGILASESFTLSQSYYFGSTPTNNYTTIEVAGEYLDRMPTGLDPFPRTV